MPRESSAACRKSALWLATVVVGSGFLSACSRDVQATDPQKIDQQYGVGGARLDEVVTPDGPIKGTVVPVTLADGRQAQLVIPNRRGSEPHSVYLRDQQGLHPVQVKEHTTRADVSNAPAIVERRAEPNHPHKRSWEQEALIIGGSAGAGTAIGAVAGGKKGAAIGATAGGIGGLIYDLATKK
jgi:hypothetical protein